MSTVDDALLPVSPPRRTGRTDSHAFQLALMTGPATLLLLVFLVVPFVLAVGLTLTDQRLLSPNPTQFVGLSNFDRLLSLQVVTLAPLRDAGGRVLTNEDGQPRYRSLRTLLREDPALRDYRPLAEVGLGASRYVLVAKDPVFYRSLVNTFFFAFTVVPLQCALALGLALLVNRTLAGRNFFRTVYFAPVVTSMVVVSVVWTFLYDPHHGLINQYLGALSFGWLGPVDWLGNPGTALPAIVVMSAWQGAGFQMLIVLAGLQGISRELYEAARLDGASGWQQFWHVTLPGLRNTLVFVVISTTILAFALFTQVDVMTGGGPEDATSTVMFHAVTEGFRRQDIAYGSTISLVYFLMILSVSLLQKRLIDRE